MTSSKRSGWKIFSTLFCTLRSVWPSLFIKKHMHHHGKVVARTGRAFSLGPQHHSVVLSTHIHIKERVRAVHVYHKGWAITVMF